MNIKCELFNDHFQNYKRYGIPKAQLVIADIPYNLGKNAYASSTEWYVDGDSKKGESDKANKAFFDTDENFRIAEFMHFCSKMLIKEPKEKGKAPCMVVFCAFQQLEMVIEHGRQHGFKGHIPLVFIKKTSPQVLKANMKIVGATEYALVLYRDKLPKFNNDGRMVLNWFHWETDNSYPKIHPTQKPVPILKQLIEIFTDAGDVVIDPCAGSGSTLRAAAELNRNAFGFEIKKDMFQKANDEMLSNIQTGLLI
nr:site-specific DNA-methyltransferase [Enterococcus faecium]